MLADGWARVTQTDGVVRIIRLDAGALVYVEAGDKVEPVVLLTVEEHAALLRDADMWRRLKELPSLVLRTGED